MSEGNNNRQGTLSSLVNRFRRRSNQQPAMLAQVFGIAPAQIPEGTDANNPAAAIPVAAMVPENNQNNQIPPENNQIPTATEIPTATVAPNIVQQAANSVRNRVTEFQEDRRGRAAVAEHAPRFFADVAEQQRREEEAQRAGGGTVDDLLSGR